MNFKILICLALITTLIACGGAEERKAVYLEKAKSSIELGDLDKARVELKNVLQIDPKDDEAYYYLGTVFEQQKDYQKAYRNYLKAEELNPDNLANQARLGRIYLTLANDLVKTQEKIDFILSKDPGNFDGLMLKASLMIKNNDKAEAIKIVKGILEKEPDNVEAVSVLAALYIIDNNNQQAISLLDNALAIKNDNEKLNKLLALTLVKNKDYERAEVIYKNFLTNHPDSTASYNNLASLYDQIGNKVKAEEVLRSSIDNDPDDISRQLTFVNYVRSAKSIDDAIDELKQLIAKRSGIGKLRIALGELLYINNDKQSAIDVFKKAIADFPDEATGVDARISLATIYLNDKDAVHASEVVEQAIMVSPNDPKVNLLRAKIALQEKNTEKAILSLRVVTKETPENIKAYLLLVNAYQLEKNSEQVRNTLNSAYENNKMDPKALLILAEYALSIDMGLSEKIIDDYNNLKVSDYDGLSIKAAILNQRKEFPQAYKIAEKLIDQYPDKPNGYLQIIPYYRLKEDVNTAISILEKGYISAKENRKLLVLLTSFQVSEKEFDIVEKRIKSELQATPDDVELKLLLAKVYMAKNDADSAVSLLIEIINENKSDLEEPYLLLAQNYQSRNDLSSVKSTLIKGKAAVASSIKIAFRLATIYELDGDYKSAIDVYRELYQKYPENLIVINNLASMLSDHSNDQDDLTLSKMLVEKLQISDQPVFLDTVGWVYYNNGDYKTAIQHLSRVVEKMPDVNVFNYHLGMAYKMVGDTAQARVYLERSLSDGKQFTQRSLAETALKDL